jgi:hypothetical protein
MKYQSVPVQLDLNDPEEGFSFSSSRDGVDLSFVDWTAKRTRVRFTNVFRFCFSISNGFGEYPEAEFIEVLDSPEISELITKHVATPGDALRHFVISTNEDQWCEVIASGYLIEGLVNCHT